MFWVCCYCQKEVWGTIGQIIKRGKEKLIAHASCVTKEREVNGSHK